MLVGSWWRERMDHPGMLLWAVIVAVVARVTIFLYAAVNPFENEGGTLVSPTEVQQGVDIGFYLGSQASYGQLAGNIERSYQELFSGSNNSRFYLSGPVFPLLLALFDYGEGETFSLAVCFLVISCALAIGWLFWLHRQGMGPVWLLLFAVVPNPIWFTLNISTDLLFSAFFAAFFCLFFGIVSS